MDIQAEALKQELYNMLNLTDDLEILKKVYGVFSENKPKTDWWDELTENQKEMVRIGTEQADRGQVVAHSEVRKRIIELRKKYV